VAQRTVTAISFFSDKTNGTLEATNKQTKNKKSHTFPDIILSLAKKPFSKLLKKNLKNFNFL
jgi:hypothetical protein